MTPDQPTLERFLVDLATDAGVDAPRPAGPATEFARRSRLFAVAAGNAAEFRLDAEIADAALRTPSTAPSTRGPDWVRLVVSQPTSTDFDRARAWFLSASRNAGRRA